MQGSGTGECQPRVKSVAGGHGLGDSHPWGRRGDRAVPGCSAQILVEGKR